MGEEKIAEKRFNQAIELVEGLVDSQDATASQVINITNELRRQFLTAKIGQEVQGMNSSEIQVVINDFVQGNLKADETKLKQLLTKIRGKNYQIMDLRD